MSADLLGVFDGSYTPSLIADESFRVTHLNRAFTRVLGYTIQDIPDIGAWWLAAYPDAEYREYLKSLWAHRVETMGSGPDSFISPLEATVRIKDGSTIVMEIGAARINHGMLVHFNDISARKHAEVLLQKSEEHARLAIEGAKIGTWDWNLFDNTLVMNAREFELLGLQPSNAPVNVDIFLNCVHPEDSKRIAQAIQDSIKTQTSFTNEYRIVLPSGAIRWLYGAGRAHKDVNTGTVLRISGIDCDITDRKLLEENLRNNELRFFGIINSAMDGIITINEQQQIVVFNAAAEKLFFCSAKDAVGSNIDRFIPDRFREKHSEHIRQFARDGTSKRSMGRFGTINGLRANGQEFPIEASISQIVFDGQRLLTVTLRDATDRHLAEQVRTDLEAQLRQSQKLESIGTLAGGIAHDFNNILGIILTNAELMDSDLPPDSRQRIHLDRIQTASQRAAKLIQQILTFSRRKKDVLPEKFILDTSIQESLALLRSSIPASVEIHSRLNSKEASIFGDPTQIHQVIMNLVTNAWQAMPQHRGLIEISSGLENHSNSLVAGESFLPAGEYIHCVVRDNGAGIPEENIHRIFDPFFTTKAPGQGTGLGLAVVHGIIRGTGGAVYAKSGVERGAEFHFYLPVFKGLDNRSPSIERFYSEQGAGEHIVLVDDEEDLNLVTQESLEQLGYRVTSFSDPRTALQYICSHDDACSLLITDMTMPFMTGVELVAAIRKQHEQIPVLLVTGLSDSVPDQQLHQLGIASVLLKPVKRKILAQAVSHVLTPARNK